MSTDVAELGENEAVTLLIRRHEPPVSRSKVTRGQQYRQASIQRLKDARLLSKSGRRTAAWYFAGIALECILKFKICDYHDRLYLDEIDPSLTTGRGHELERLFQAAGLWQTLQNDKPEFDKYQRGFADWGVHVRYLSTEHGQDVYEVAKALHTWIDRA